MKVRGPHDHAFDLIGEANRTGGVGDGSQTMIARQPSDQSKFLRQHRTTGTRRPEQNAARADEARGVFWYRSFERLHVDGANPGVPALLQHVDQVTTDEATGARRARRWARSRAPQRPSHDQDMPGACRGESQAELRAR
jgi:hypothetical protein